MPSIKFRLRPTGTGIPWPDSVIYGIKGEGDVMMIGLIALELPSASPVCALGLRLIGASDGIDTDTKGHKMLSGATRRDAAWWDKS